ncbi:hypothetical protein ASZ90_007700 [hydrocarbon metagenome]|uniref:Uncharacterized protein n=1 Tax=hydrocarbon metagenome TaxID=938273 RepID=A0A0W8FNR5_9ZZZZ
MFTPPGTDTKQASETLQELLLFIRKMRGAYFFKAYDV